MRPSFYRHYLVALLAVILAFNNVDRLALGLFLQQIKVDLTLTDTQLGLLTGIAFSVFYSLMGIPIARWADRGNRTTIITVTTALWSAAVAFCGAAGSFLQLLLIRVGVAVGEAGAVPPAHSLIADYFPRAERPRAVARYMLGTPLSAVFGYFLAGWLDLRYGWRITFSLLGLPGLILAILAWLTVREPRASSVAPAPQAPASMTVANSERIPLKDVYASLWANRTYRHLLMGYSLMSLFGGGIAQWKPAFFIRSYGLETREVGAWFAAIHGLGGLLGMYCGGELAARYAAHQEQVQLKGIGVAYACFGLVSVGMYLVPNPYLAFALLAVSLIGVYATYGPLFATLQTLVQPSMRAISVATTYLCANLIGLGLGPLAAGLLSDTFHAWAGRESLRYALLALTPGYFWAAWHLWRANRTVAGDLNAVQQGT